MSRDSTQSLHVQVELSLGRCGKPLVHNMEADCGREETLISDKFEGIFLKGKRTEYLGHERRQNCGKG